MRIGQKSREENEQKRIVKEDRSEQKKRRV